MELSKFIKRHLVRLSLLSKEQYNEQDYFYEDLGKPLCFKSGLLVTKSKWYRIEVKDKIVFTNLITQTKEES